LLTLGLTGAFVFLGYVVFGLTGFGASVVAIPLIAQVIPLKLAVPMMLIMDLVAGIFVGARNNRDVDRGELKALVLWILLGMVVGLTLLVSAPEPILLVALGLFAVFQATRNLALRPNHGPIQTGWRIVYGSIGGAFTSLFGTGGPIYAMYLSRRIPLEAKRRATLALLIWFTSFARLALFLVAGLMWQPQLFTLVLVCLPLCLLGAYSGSAIRKRLQVHHLNRLVWVIVGLAGISLLIRYIPAAMLLI
jgi:hypothetical protein